MVYINLKDATGTAHPSGVHEFTPVLSGVRVFLFLVCLLCTVLPTIDCFCLSSSIVLSFHHLFTAFYYLFGIFKLFLSLKKAMFQLYHRAVVIGGGEIGNTETKQYNEEYLSMVI